MQSKQKFYFLLFSWQVKSMPLQVVFVASVQACAVIKCFHYLYESPQQSGIARRAAAAAVSTFGLTERPDFLFRVFLELEAQEETASPDRELPLPCRNLPTNPFACGLAFEGACLFLTFLVNLPWEHWIPSSLVHVLSSDSRGRWWASRGRGEEADAGHANRFDVFWCMRSLIQRVCTR